MLIDDKNSITQADNFRKIGGDDNHTNAFTRKPAQQLVDLFFRAHINTLGWFVQNQNFRMDRQPFRKHDLLLIAAGERCAWLIDSPCFDI